MDTNEKEKIIYQAAEIIQDLSEKGYTKYRIAKETSIAEKTIGNYVNGVNKPSFANAKIIIKYYTGEGEMLKNNDSSLILSNQSCQPILDIRVCAGHGIGLEGDENKIIEWVNIPKFDGCYGITVYGDSMYDRFKSGDIIFVRPIEGRNDFDFGQCYIIITNEDRYIKNVYESDKGDQYITMTSFNVDINPDGRRKYPDRDIYVGDIKHLYKVAGKLRRDQL